MTRGSVAVLAVRIVSLWLIVSGIAAGASLLLVKIPSPVSDATTPTLLFAVLPVVTGLFLWSLAPPIAARIFRDRDGEGVPGLLDLYRVASVFTGLGLVAWGIPQAASLISAWLMRLRSGGGLLGEGGTPLVDFQLKTGFVTTVVQLSLGAILLLKPSVVERILRMWSPPTSPPPRLSDGRGEAGG